METKPMKILIIEDDIEDCNKFIECIKSRNDIELVAVTDSDVDGLRYAKINRPEGIILDLELNNSKSGSTDSMEFVPNLKKLNLNPIVIVTTHVNSRRTYDTLHKKGVDLILYKDHPNYSCNHVLNQFINLRKNTEISSENSVEELLQNVEEKISKLINYELDLVGVPSKMVGRKYMHDGIMYLIQNEESQISVNQYLTKIYKKPETTINNGIKNAIVKAWKISAVEDLLKHYTNRINPETGIPTPMEFVYYYRDKIKTMI